MHELHEAYEVFYQLQNQLLKYRQVNPNFFRENPLAELVLDPDKDGLEFTRFVLKKRRKEQSLKIE